MMALRMAAHEHITHSAEETMALGRELAPTLKSARMVILRGDLGTGKTTLVKGIAEGLEAASNELLAEDGNLVLLEWGEKFPRFEKERDVEISIERRGDQERKFTIKRK
jgi:tRNA threonylcarbamoyladenosine biosynthesis protein TsaE